MWSLHQILVFWVNMDFSFPPKNPFENHPPDHVSSSYFTRNFTYFWHHEYWISLKKKNSDSCINTIKIIATSKVKSKPLNQDWYVLSSDHLISFNWMFMDLPAFFTENGHVKRDFAKFSIWSFQLYISISWVRFKARFCLLQVVMWRCSANSFSYNSKKFIASSPKWSQFLEVNLTGLGKVHFQDSLKCLLLALL